MVLEVREEILRAQVNNKWCDAQRLAIGTVNEKTTYSGEKSREAKRGVNFREFGEAKSFIYISLLFQLQVEFSLQNEGWEGQKGEGHLIHYKISTVELAWLPLLTKDWQLNYFK